MLTVRRLDIADVNSLGPSAVFIVFVVFGCAACSRRALKNNGAGCGFMVVNTRKIAGGIQLEGRNPFFDSFRPANAQGLGLLSIGKIHPR